MKNSYYILIAMLMAACFYCCSSTTTKTHFVTMVTYDTLSNEINECPVIRLFFTTGFDNNSLIVNWNNSIIYNGAISTDKIKGVALQSVTIPKNKGSLTVSVDEISIEDEVDIDYCNMIFHRSGDTLFLNYTNRHPEFD